MNSICRLISQQRLSPTKRLVVFQSCYATKTKAKPKTTNTDSSTTATAGGSQSPEAPHSPSWKIISPTVEPKPEKNSASEPARPRPREVPFQAKVSNSVHLIGYVHAPVQFETTADGSSWAATVITQNPSSSDDDDPSSDALPLW